MPEAKLAREAELCYAAVSLVTDYDCWRPHRSELGGQELLEEIIGNLKTTTGAALALLNAALPGGAVRWRRAGAPVSSRWSGRSSPREAQIHEETRKELDLLLRRAPPGTWIGTRRLVQRSA